MARQQRCYVKVDASLHSFTERLFLSTDEQRFLEASMGYANGHPVMSDEEFDKLKQRLKNQGSSITLAVRFLSFPKLHLHFRVLDVV